MKSNRLQMSNRLQTRSCAVATMCPDSQVHARILKIITVGMLLAASLIGAPSWAQTSAQTATQNALPATSAPLRIGDATERLLALQANGSAAAPRLPMLGPAASAGYKRYLDSFGHPIPETFDQKVKSSSSGS